ncbi:hypothetical protein FRC06_008387 [Ceratobasidium sp. 370]|nr:hypothetical protein FRC06_008387 [Ceratobasidium sp. 370]
MAATLTMTPIDSPRPNKRFRRSTTSDTSTSRTRSHAGSRPARSASTSSYPHPSRRNSTSAPTPHANAHSRTTSFSHGSPFASSSSRLRSAAEARALLLDPAYSGVGQCQSQQARVFVDESGVAHDPDYRMFPPAVPSSPSRPNMARRGSMTSARGRYPVGSVGGCSDAGVSPFAGSPFAGYADFTARYSTSGHHEADSDDEVEAQMDIDEDAESELEWSRLHASASPPGYGSNSGSATQEGGEKTEEDGYADFAGMEWDEKEWRREEVAPALDKHNPAPTAKGKHVAPQPPAQAPAPSSAPASVKSYPKSKSKSNKIKAESVSSATARGYVPAKRSYDESVQDEWTPSCGYSVRRHWQSFTLRIRFSVFRWRRRLRRAFAAATTAATAPSVTAEQRT